MTRSIAASVGRLGFVQPALALLPEPDQVLEAHRHRSAHRGRACASGGDQRWDWPVIAYERSPGRTMPSARASRTIVAGSLSDFSCSASPRFWWVS